MVTPTSDYTKKISRKGKFLITEKETGLVMVMNRPAGMTLNNGLENNQPITETDEQGYETKVANNFSGRKPTIDFTFSGRNLDIVALSLNQKTQSSVVTLRYPARQQIKQAEYNPSTTGKLGYAVQKDADTRASFKNHLTGESEILTQQSWDSFNPAIAKSFAIGESFARKFSNDLVTNQQWVGLLPSADYAARSLAEGLLGFLEITGLCFYTDNTVEAFYADNCFVNPEGAGLKEGDNTVQFDVNSLGACQPWNIYELKEETFCDD